MVFGGLCIFVRSLSVPSVANYGRRISCSEHSLMILLSFGEEGEALFPFLILRICVFSKSFPDQVMQRFGYFVDLSRKKPTFHLSFFFF